MSNNANELRMLPSPIDPRLERHLARILIGKLEDTSLENLVEERIEEILNWDKMDNPVLKRRYRNYSLVYSREELKSWTLVTYKKILNKYGS